MRIRTLVQLGGLSLTGALLWRGLRWLASDDPRVCGLALALFRAQERRHPPPPHPVVFTGSSSIALWRTLAQDMAGLAVLNRGIAGAKFPHLVHHAEALVTRYRPRAVVVFAGTNDIAWPAPKPPDAILACFQAFVTPCPKLSPRYYHEWLQRVAARETPRHRPAGACRCHPDLRRGRGQETRAHHL